MKIENKFIDTIQASQLKTENIIHISNSIIKTLDFIAFESESQIIIENSIIYDLQIHSCWFRKGLLFRNNQVMNYIDYQMGGHNIDVIYIESNIFHNFFNFFDCYFTGSVVIEKNIFLKGTNIIGNQSESWKNIFDKDHVIRENIGAVNFDGIGE